MPLLFRINFYQLAGRTFAADCFGDEVRR